MNFELPPQRKPARQLYQTWNMESAARGRASLLAAAPATASVDDSHPAALRRPSVERAAPCAAPMSGWALAALMRYAITATLLLLHLREPASSVRRKALIAHGLCPRLAHWHSEPRHTTDLWRHCNQCVKGSAQLHGLCSALWRASVRPVMMQE